MTEAPPVVVEDPDPPPITIADLCGTGATYRQIDYWCRMGYLAPDRERVDVLPGSGNRRVWTPRDVTVCRLMVRLIEAGVIVTVAAEAAGLMADSGRDTVHLNGIEITLLREDLEW